MRLKLSIRQLEQHNPRKVIYGNMGLSDETEIRSAESNWAGHSQQFNASLSLLRPICRYFCFVLRCGKPSGRTIGAVLESCGAKPACPRANEPRCAALGGRMAYWG